MVGPGWSGTGAWTSYARPPRSLRHEPAYHAAMRAMLLALLTASAFAQSPVRPALPANEATALRKQLTEALADPGSSAARDLGK